MGYCVGQWVGSCQITRNSIFQKLIKIIQFCLKVFVFCLHSHPIPATQPPTPLDYTQISNNQDNSILLEDLNSTHGWVNGLMGGLRAGVMSNH